MSKVINGIKRRIDKYLIQPMKPWGFFGSYVFFPIKMGLRRIGVGPKYFKQIEKINGSNKGKRCFVIATGPSLTIEDLQMLRDEITIGENSLFKLYDELGWIPSYYAMIDPTLTEDIIINNPGLDFNKFAKNYCFFNSLNRNIINCDKAIYFDVNWLDHIYHYGKSKRFRYNPDIMYGIYDCYSITQMCVLIAIYMGFDEVYIIGADNNYFGEKQHFAEYAGETKADYETAMLMQNANDYGYEYVNYIAEKENVKIFNATRGGNIKCLERVKLEEIVNRL